MVNGGFIGAYRGSKGACSIDYQACRALRWVFDVSEGVVDKPPSAFLSEAQVLAQAVHHKVRRVEVGEA